MYAIRSYYELLEDIVGKGVGPGAASFPDLLHGDGDHLHLDLLAVPAVQVEDRGDRGLADQAEHVDP